MSPSDAPINWKRNLAVAWLGCFLTGAAFSLVMPFLPLYVEQLGVTGHSALNMWSGLVFSVTFLFSAIASPFWGGLADRKGRKIMLLRSALGMAIVMMLMGMAQNIWQFLLLRALLGLLGGFIPNANALIVVDLSKDVTPLIELSCEQIRERLPRAVFAAEYVSGWGSEPGFELHTREPGSPFQAPLDELVDRDEIVKLIVVDPATRTDELAAQSEVQSIVSAAADGDFSARLESAGKTGFFLRLAGDLNRLRARVEGVLWPNSGMTHGT